MGASYPGQRQARNVRFDVTERTAEPATVTSIFFTVDYRCFARSLLGSSALFANSAREVGA